MSVRFMSFSVISRPATMRQHATTIRIGIVDRMPLSA